MRAAMAIVLLAGCELVFPLRDPDAAVLRCDVGTPFGGGVEVPIAGDHSVEGARFDPTQSVAYLSLCPTQIGNKAMCDLYVAPFVVTTGQFGNLARLGISDPEAYDAYPTITPDSKFILFGSSRDDGPHVFIAEENNGGFDATATQVPVGKMYSNEPYLIGQGRTLYYSASNADFDWNLSRATGTPPDFIGFDELAVVNSPEVEFCPVPSEDELELFFASNRLDPSREEEGLDIFTATRSDTASAFSSPERVASLSTNGPDFPLWLSPDGCDLYYINKVTDSDTEIGTLYVSSRRQ